MANGNRPAPKSGDKPAKRKKPRAMSPKARGEIEDLLGDFSEQTGSLFG